MQLTALCSDLDCCAQDFGDNTHRVLYEARLQVHNYWFWARRYGSANRLVRGRSSSLRKCQLTSQRIRQELWCLSIPRLHRISHEN